VRRMLGMLFAVVALACGATVDTSGEPTDEPEGLPCNDPLPCEVDAGEGPRCCVAGRWGFCDEHAVCEPHFPD
jgi:hypothetical protein